MGMGLSDNFDLFLGIGPSFSFLVNEDNWGRKLVHIAVDAIDKDLSSMGWRSTEVGLNLGGGVKIMKHLMLSCYYNIGLTESARHHIGGDKHDAIDQISMVIFSNQETDIGNCPLLIFLIK